jgi:hypothetical protein
LLTNLDYAQFSVRPVDGRIDWFDELTWDSMAVPAEQRTIKRFLSAVYEHDPNQYVRKKAVEWIGELALANVLRRDFARDFLLDVDVAQERYISICKLKYLFLLTGDDAEVYTELTSARQQPDAEVASEAYFRQGLVHLLYRTGQAAEKQFFEEVAHAERCFQQAQALAENRVDAQFFSLVANCLLAMLGQQREQYVPLLAALNTLLWQRQLWSWQPPAQLLEWHVLHGLETLRQLAEQTAAEAFWTDYRQEFGKLNKLCNDIALVDSLSPALQQSYQQFADGVATRLIRHYYVQNLSACQVKISAVAAELDAEDAPLAAFLRELTLTLEKKSPDPTFDQVAQLLSAFPHLGADRILRDVAALRAAGEDELQLVLTLTFRYLQERPQGSFTDYQTGFLVGDEVLQSVAREINQALPAYPARSISTFLRLLADVISYAYRAATQPRRFFPHLYDPAVKKEETFQNHLFTTLTAGPRATYYSYEPADKIGSGRIDIVYAENGLIFPLEVKKEDRKPDWPTIQTHYLAQAQTYVHAYHQLGLLVVFDISPKKAGAPVNDFRELFALLHLEPYYSLGGSRPDYLVVCLIPGNKVSPSDYSTYSAA